MVVTSAQKTAVQIYGARSVNELSRHSAGTFLGSAMPCCVVMCCACAGPDEPAGQDQMCPHRKNWPLWRSSTTSLLHPRCHPLLPLTSAGDVRHTNPSYSRTAASAAYRNSVSPTLCQAKQRCLWEPILEPLHSGLQGRHGSHTGGAMGEASLAASACHHGCLAIVCSCQRCQRCTAASGHPEREGTEHGPTTAEMH
jgi:hypothetical protein